ncbi:MAG: alpha/beta hydrolase [Gammaproteobacteria bacterium]|nr:alpha/beta hydrolase [Gammaproteobacteria bacterium]
MAFMLAAAGFAPAAGAAETTRVLSLQSLASKYASPGSQFVELDGIRIRYRDEGAGPAVLLVHGTLGDLADWDGWIDLLADRYRVIRLDLPGFGLSGEVPNGNYSIDRMLSLVDGLMDHLRQESFALVGISLGGAIAFRYAATRTSRVKSLVLINSAGMESGRPIDDADRAEKTSRPRNDIFTGPVVTPADIAEFYSAYTSDPSRLPDSFIQRKVDFLNVRGRDEIGRRIMALYERGDPQRVLAHVRAPSLVLWGAHNFALDTRVARQFASALTGACLVELVVLEQGGHYINVERPRESAGAALAFLDRSAKESGCSQLRDCLRKGN